MNEALVKEIEAGKAAPVYLITGEEFLVRQAADEIVSKLVPKAMAGLNLAIHEGSSPSEVARDLATIPMFRGRKVVVLREPEFLAPKKGRTDALAKIKEAWNAGRKKAAAQRALALMARSGWGVDELLAPDPTAIEQELEIALADADVGFLQEIGRFCRDEKISTPESDTGALEKLLQQGLPRDHHLIIEAVQVDNRLSLVKLCSKLGVVVERKVESELRKLDIRELVNQVLGPRKKKLDADAQRLLKDLCGSNMRLLHSELEKLALHAGDAPVITAEQVQLLVQRVREEEFRELSEALNARNLKASLSYVDIALDQGEAPLKILGAIASIVRRLLEDRDRWGQLGFSARTGQREFEAKGMKALAEECKARGTKLPHPYYAWLCFQACWRYEVRDLVKAMLATAQADMALKSSRNSTLVLQTLILKICGAG